MLRPPEPLSPRTQALRDLGLLVFFGLLLTPVYLVLNQYWQSVLRLIVLYALLGLFCLRLGSYMRRALRRWPAEIPPWGEEASQPTPGPWLEQRFGAAEAMRSVRQDPHYVQNVLKPRLRRLLAYRLTGAPEVPLEALDAAQLARIDPVLLAFLQRREPTGLWARWRRRRQRVDDVLDSLRRLEAL
jgi:hypothetical protein